MVSSTTAMKSPNLPQPLLTKRKGQRQGPVSLRGSWLARGRGGRRRMRVGGVGRCTAVIGSALVLTVPGRARFGHPPGIDPEECEPLAGIDRGQPRRIRILVLAVGEQDIDVVIVRGPLAPVVAGALLRLVGDVDQLGH